MFLSKITKKIRECNCEENQTSKPQTRMIYLNAVNNVCKNDGSNRKNYAENRNNYTPKRNEVKIR